MKKKVITAALLLPLTLVLCACGGTPQLSLSANWYRFPDSSSSIGGKSEQLEYEVTFKPSDVNHILSYDKGSYTTSLETASLPGSGEQGYHLHSELHISGTFTVGGESKDFTDLMESDVYFKILTSNLQPVRSEKHVKSTSAVTASPVSLEKAFTEYEYTYTVEYTENLSEAAITYSQTLPEEQEKQETVSIGDTAAFFDNEQIFFVLRGLDMSSAVTLRSINPLDCTVTSVSMGQTPSQTILTDFSFELNGNTVSATEENPIKAYSTSIAQPKGQSQTLVYAGNTTSFAGENLYRNALLQMSVPILQSLGSLNYTLVKATFSE